ncbi:flagellar hook-length control protein FliK [Variovorax sp. GB1R11]|uniref:flagellar hook-length control protein FliK n=1 Tax=Variovorax sp. GB1R11 TaxID=3443741 RepID=UPI003F47D15E
MTGLAGLIDALLAARLAPRLDVLGIKGETTIGAPGPAVGVGKVDNDVRLPSNAALDRQIPGALTGGAVHAGGGAPSSVATRLSVAARVIGAVLADLQAQPGPVRGAAPLLASGQQPASAAALAGALARTVSDSGLFYEAHLAEFATGTRTLAQMAREPQARWAGPLVARPETAAAPVNAATATATATAMATAADAVDVLLPAGAPQAAAAVAQGELPHAAAPSPHTPATAPSTHAAAQPGAAQAPDPAASAVSVDALRLQAAYGQSDGATARTALDGDMPAHRAGEIARSSESAAVAQAARGTEVIHPQAVTLVHQQLDLLASAAFRWSGQAWPDVPMRWSVEQEQDRHDAREGADSAPQAERRWSTTVSLSLPRLGEVDLRLSLAGAAVQAHLSAREATTTERLRGDAGQLAKRFEAAGFQLQQLQVTEKAMAEAA